MPINSPAELAPRGSAWALSPVAFVRVAIAVAVLRLAQGIVTASVWQQAMDSDHLAMALALPASALWYTARMMELTYAVAVLLHFAIVPIAVIAAAAVRRDSAKQRVWRRVFWWTLAATVAFAVFTGWLAWAYGNSGPIGI
ncbi:MAG: hypothetical protein WAO61_06855 [Solirubrobacterales bacterium]